MVTFSQNVTKQTIDSILATKDVSAFKTLLRQIDQSKNSESISNFKYVDSIVKQNDTLRLHTYIYYTSTLMRAGKNTEALAINTKGLALAKKQNSPYFLFKYYQLRADIFDNNAVLDSTLFYINKAENIVLKHKEALGYNLVSIYRQRAILEEKLGNPEKEDAYIEKIVEVVEVYPDKKGNALNLAMVVYHFKTKKNYIKHAFYAEKLREFYLKRDGFNAPKAHESLSSMLKIDDANAQITKLKQRLNTNDSLQNKFILPQIANNLGATLLELGNNEDAIIYLKKSIDYNANDLNPYSQVISYENLHRAYLNLKDYPNAIEALYAKNNLINEIREKETLKKVSELKVKYETEKKNAELELLKSENKAKEKQNLVYLILAISGLLLAVLLGFFSYKLNTKKRLLSIQKSELEKAIEDKNLLFKEVHHRVKNSLQMVSSLLFLQSQNIENTEAKSAMTDAQNRVRSLTLIHQKLYSKKHLVGVETKDYITDLIQDIFSSHQLESQHIKTNLEIENIVLSVDTLTPIGLILNELIVNVLKHAFNNDTEDNILSITFYKNNGSLILKVADNGIGYDNTNGRKNSFGIKLINSLARKLDAQFSIANAQNQGSEAKLTINDFEIVNGK